MVDRPDLDEFLSALNGFLDKPSSGVTSSSAAPGAKDPSHLRFLEIFLRSVGSSEGHLLHATDQDGLRSATTFGIRPTFEKEFNELMSKKDRDLTPLDAAYRDQQVVAVVEVKRGLGILPEFLELMARYDFKALIAVPLMGQRRAVGLLCAYYRDVCLFDRNTMDRLMTIGRMVGAATEKSVAAGRMASLDEHEKAVDDYLAAITRDPLTRVHVYELLAHATAKALHSSGLMCGPLHMDEKSLSLTVSDGAGIPASAIGQRFCVAGGAGATIVARRRQQAWHGVAGGSMGFHSFFHAGFRCVDVVPADCVAEKSRRRRARVAQRATGFLDGRQHAAQAPPRV